MAEPLPLRCRQCGVVYHPVFFRNALTTAVVKYKRTTCIGCELTARTEAKQRNRPREKARKALGSHAARFIREGQAHSVKDFCERYGWTIERLAHDLAHTYENTCPYCWQPFVEMEHGLADVTLDIVDPARPPFYRTNVRWCCATCNREKQRTDPELWEIKLAMWRRWRAQIAIAPAQLTLLDFA